MGEFTGEYECYPEHDEIEEDISFLLVGTVAETNKARLVRLRGNGFEGLTWVPKSISEIHIARNGSEIISVEGWWSPTLVEVEE